jgi:PHP family Zn ribbon phosphoesterase
MANIGTNYENKCSRCGTTWRVVGVVGTKACCPNCGSKNGVVRMRVHSISNFKKPVIPSLHI